MERILESQSQFKKKVSKFLKLFFTLSIINFTQIFQKLIKNEFYLVKNNVKNVFFVKSVFLAQTDFN